MRPFAALVPPPPIHSVLSSRLTQKVVGGFAVVFPANDGSSLPSPGGDMGTQGYDGTQVGTKVIRTRLRRSVLFTLYPVRKIKLKPVDRRAESSAWRRPLFFFPSSFLLAGRFSLFKSLPYLSARPPPPILGPSAGLHHVCPLARHARGSLDVVPHRHLAVKGERPGSRPFSDAVCFRQGAGGSEGDDGNGPMCSLFSRRCNSPSPPSLPPARLNPTTASRAPHAHRLLRPDLLPASGAPPSARRGCATGIVPAACRHTSFLFASFRPPFFAALFFPALNSAPPPPPLAPFFWGGRTVPQ